MQGSGAGAAQAGVTGGRRPPGADLTVGREAPAEGFPAERLVDASESTFRGAVEDGLQTRRKGAVKQFGHNGRSGPSSHVGMRTRAKFKVSGGARLGHTPQGEGGERARWTNPNWDGRRQSQTSANTIHYPLRSCSQENGRKSKDPTKNTGSLPKKMGPA